MMTYFPSWAAAQFPPEKLDFTRFDWVDFAFAVPKKDFSLGWDGDEDEDDDDSGGGGGGGGDDDDDGDDHERGAGAV